MRRETRPEATSRAPLTVVIEVQRDEKTEQDVMVSEWSTFIEQVARSFGLDPVVVEHIRVETAELRADRLLSHIAAVPGPVLVFPSSTTHSANPASSNHQLHEVLIASDASRAVERGARTLQRQLRDHGMHTTVLMVLAPSTVPRMWEGPGHHAAAWRTELVRRHGGPDSLDIVTGDPCTEIFDRTESADLLVLFWKQTTEPGRSAVVRSVLAEGTEVPCLLFPI